MRKRESYPTPPKNADCWWLEAPIPLSVLVSSLGRAPPHTTQRQRNALATIVCPLSLDGSDRSLVCARNLLASIAQCGADVSKTTRQQAPFRSVSSRFTTTTTFQQNFTAKISPQPLLSSRQQVDKFHFSVPSARGRKETCLPDYVCGLIIIL